MRARGANITDIVVLVVAADDSVKPQTIEAINHAKEAKVPMIVAINKIDKQGSDPNKVRTELLQHGIIVESMSGDVLEAEISAMNGTGLEKFVFEKQFTDQPHCSWLQRIREVESHRQHLTTCSDPGSPWLRAARDHDPATWPVGQDYSSQNLLFPSGLPFFLFHLTPTYHAMRRIQKICINLKNIYVDALPIGGVLNNATRPDQRWRLPPKISKCFMYHLAGGPAAIL